MIIVIMIEYCIQEEKKMNRVNMILPEITVNPVVIEKKIEKKVLPMYGIISLIIVFIGAIVVLINFNSMSISFATPFLLISVITSGEGIDADIIKGTAVIGLILGGIFLVISLSPVIQFFF